MTGTVVTGSVVTGTVVARSEASGLASRTDLYEEVGEPCLSESGQVPPDCRLDQGGECPSGEMDSWWWRTAEWRGAVSFMYC